MLLKTVPVELMSSIAGAPAGGRKYLLVQPDTFELLVKNFQEVQALKQDPGINLAIKLSRSMSKVNQSKGGAVGERQGEAKKILMEHVTSLSSLYAESSKQYIKQIVVKQEVEDEETPLSPSLSSSDTVSNAKKRKWFSFQ